jgi:phosphatidylserine/phosphatidylglycerophosphate/cardiolipin synthase-like enzyme
MQRWLRMLPLVLATGCVGEPEAIPEAYDEETAATPCEGKCDAPGEMTGLPALPSTTVATLFAPYEPALGLDLLLIRQVVAARAADPATYPEGENPFRIRFAAYNLDNPYLAEALADAEAANVDVQILIESDQLDPAKEYNIQDDYLVDRGFELALDHAQLDDAGRITADLVGIRATGLMHLKTRLYTWNDAGGQSTSRLVTGSLNPGNLSMHNDETLHYIEIPEIIARYQAKYDAVLRGVKITNTWNDGAGAQVLFSPDGGPQAIDKIAALIDQEQESILVATFSLRNMSPTTGGKGILHRLVDAHERGVAVVVITDRKQSDGIDSDGNPVYANDPSEEILRSAGIPVYEVLNKYSPYNAMHHKYAVFGVTRPIVVTDAGNWSKASLGSGTVRPINHESVLFVDSMTLDGGVTGKRYLGNFLEVIQKYGTQGADGQTPTGGPDPQTIVERLQAIAGWPTVDVTFQARVQTVFGENVFATGDHSALGDWTRTGPGHALVTGPATYPMWTAAPLALPFGTRLAYKLIKRRDGVIWENGSDRGLIVDSTDRRVVGGYPQPAITTDLTWR